MRSPRLRRWSPRTRAAMADARAVRLTAKTSRLMIGLAQLLLVIAAGALWAASRLPWVVIRSFDGLGPPKEVTLSGASWSTALLPMALLMLAAAGAGRAIGSGEPYRRLPRSQPVGDPGRGGTWSRSCAYLGDVAGGEPAALFGRDGCGAGRGVHFGRRRPADAIGFDSRVGTRGRDEICGARDSPFDCPARRRGRGDAGEAGDAGDVGADDLGCA